MSAMLREAGLLKELAKANERIRQLEAERVPEGWKLVFAPFDCHGTRLCPFCGCRTNANAMACCTRAANESIAAAPAQEKSLCDKCGGSGEHALANTGITDDDNCRACSGSGYAPQKKKENSNG